jgi:tetratricopeptide (TPR) repeat protein
MPLISHELAGKLLFPEQRRKAMDAAQQLLAQSAKSDIRLIIEALATLGECLKFDSKPRLAEEALLRALELIKGINDQELLGECYQALGDNWYYNGLFERAIEYYQQAAGAFQLSKDVNSLVQVWSQMANAFRELSNGEKERVCLEMGAAEADLPIVIKAALVERIALSLAKSGRANEATSKYEEALSLFEAEGFKRDWGQRVQRLAQMYQESGNDVAARKTMERL